MRYKRYTYFVLFIAAMLLISCGHKSGRRDKQNLPSRSNITQPIGKNDDFTGKTIVKMEDSNGVKYIWVEINGLNLKFIFDTGASSIAISSAEFLVLLRQGTVKEEDIIGVQYFQVATGEVSRGTRINLRTVKIGDRVLRNIEALVIDNYEASLLLGQSALEKFGKISIDNTNDVIIFE